METLAPALIRRDTAIRITTGSPVEFIGLDGPRERQISVLILGEGRH